MSNQTAGTAFGDTILIVEDDFDIRDLLQQYLEAAGYLVLPAAHGEEALAMVRANPGRLGLILLDRNMEGMDGKDFLDALEADAALKAGAPPVVMMSAGGRFEEPRAVAFLRKPFNFDELGLVVGRFVKTVS